MPVVVISVICMRTNFHLHTVSKFEEWRKKSVWGYLLLWSSWKQCNTHVYQVSFPCMLQLVSLRSEEVVLKKIAWTFVKQYSVVMETCNRHGNDTYQVSTLCVLPLESLRSEEVKVPDLSLFVVIYKHVCCDFDVGYWIHCVYKLLFTSIVSYTDTCSMPL